MSEVHKCLGVEPEAVRLLEGAALDHITAAFPAHRDGQPASRTEYWTSYVSFAHNCLKDEAEAMGGIDLPVQHSLREAFDAMNAAYHVFAESFMRYASGLHREGEDLVWRLKPRMMARNVDDRRYEPVRPGSPLRVAMRARFCFERPLPANPSGPLICVWRDKDGGPAERIWAGINEFDYLKPEEIEDSARSAEIFEAIKADPRWSLALVHDRYENSKVEHVDRTPICSCCRRPGSRDNGTGVHAQICGNQNLMSPKWIDPTRLRRIDKIARY